jgi:integral membrane protein
MLKTPLSRLRWIGVLEGISYLVLLLIAMPLKYWAGWPEAVRYTGAIHGGLFILFILAVAEVTLRRPWYSPKFWGAAAIASVLPLGTFVFDYWLKQVEDRDNLAKAAAAQGTA